jgi:hypothetical protein
MRLPRSRGWILLLASLLLVVSSAASQRLRRIETTSSPGDRMLDINRIHISLSSMGNLGLLKSWNGAAEWYNAFGDSTYPSTIVFDGGLWVTCRINGDVATLPVIWRSPYSPGPAVNRRPEDSLRYHAYRYTIGDTPDLNPEAETWPADLGAPVDSSGKPSISADQMIWEVYNGLDTTRTPAWFTRNLGPMPPIPVEIRQSAFSHFGTLGDTSIWANTVFFEWRIYNRGTVPLDSVYFSYWTDIDFMGAWYNVPAVDTVGQFGYCWYPPEITKAAVGYVLLYGPQVPAPGMTATAFGKRIPDTRNLPLSAFHGISDDSFSDGAPYGPPYSVRSTWNVVRGMTPAGEHYVDSASGTITTLPWSGNPARPSGTLFPVWNTGGGAGFMMTAGPVSMAPGDSQWVMMALLPSQQTGPFDAITKIRANADYLLHLPYDSLVTRKPRRAAVTRPMPRYVPDEYRVFPAYPNPFNGGTTIVIDLPYLSKVSFTVYDLLGRRVDALPDAVYERGHRSLQWSPTLPSGFYIIRLQATAEEGPGMVFTSTQRAILIH